PAHSAVLCCLCTLLLGVFLMNRAPLSPTAPPFIGAAGLLASVFLGISTILGQYQPEHRLIWQETVGHVILMVTLGAGISALMSVLVLPTLAADEMRAKVAEAVRGIGAG
ncbi:hypothetical protein Agub_g669, partial [Astrephomene gubernaculifera]